MRSPRQELRVVMTLKLTPSAELSWYRLIQDLVADMSHIAALAFQSHIKTSETVGEHQQCNFSFLKQILISNFCLRMSNNRHASIMFVGCRSLAHIFHVATKFVYSAVYDTRSIYCPVIAGLIFERDYLLITNAASASHYVTHVCCCSYMMFVYYSPIRHYSQPSAL
jgi:hypothetical protein